MFPRLQTIKHVAKRMLNNSTYSKKRMISTNNSSDINQVTKLSSDLNRLWITSNVALTLYGSVLFITALSTYCRFNESETNHFDDDNKYIEYVETQTNHKKQSKNNNSVYY